MEKNMPIRLSSFSLAVALLMAASATAQPAPGLPGVQQVQLDVKMARMDRDWFRTVASEELKRLSPCQKLEAPGQANLFVGTLAGKSGLQRLLRQAEKQGQMKILAQPRLLVLSGQQASFVDGGEQAVPVLAGAGQVGVQFMEFGTRLNFLPVILGNGKIHLEVEPEISQLDPNAGTTVDGAAVAGRSTQRLHTTAELKSGQTFLIGGLVQKPENPGESKGELLIFVTPHVVAQPDVAPAPVAAQPAPVKGKTGEMAKLWDAYIKACDEGQPEVAKALALRLLELDPTWFRTREAR
jgi:Flp pilus assembly secretin CpaC